MTLYIAKNGQRLGPYSLAEAQGMVAAGTISGSDFAWYEGLADWIPLSQVPGFAAPVPAAGFPASQPQAQGRPVLVWIIFILTIIGLLINVLGLILIPVVLSSNIPLDEHQRKILESVTTFDYTIDVINTLISAAGVILLFMLKKPALYFYLASFALGVMMLIYNIAVKGILENMTAPGLVGMIVGWSISVAIVGYVWQLHRTGVLR